MGNNQRARTLLLWMMLATMAYLAMSMMSRPPGRVQNVQTSVFVSVIDDGTIGWVDMTGGRLYGISKDRKDIFISYTGEPKMIRDSLKAKRIPFREQPPDDGSSAAIVFQIVFMLIIGFFLFRMFGAVKGSGPGAAMQFGKSRARMINGPLVKERFTDVKGVDDAVEDVSDIVAYLKEPRKFSRLGGRMPKGILLVGPPGTGKTLLAKALAGEAGVPFFSIAGSDFVEMFVGTGASRVRDLFEQAGKNSPCIVFIDELDAVGKKRSTGPSFGSHDEREQTLNQLLVEMDGFLANQGVILVAATNKPESLDPALTRAGRFDRQVIVSPPDIRGREAIIKVHVNKRPDYVADPDLDYAKIAKSTPGLTGADIESLVNEAAVRATKAGKSRVETSDFVESIEKVVAGAERKGRLLGEEEKKIVAWHESGHAVAGHFSPGADPVHRVSIIPRGAAALGYTMSLPDSERHLYRKSQLFARIRMTLGGRAAEHILLNDDVTSGASNDFAQATAIAQRMVTQFALSSLPRRAYGSHQAGFLGEHFERDFSDETAQSIDKEVSSIIEKCFAETLELLNKHKDKLQKLAQALLVEETLDDERVLAILGPRES